MDESTADQTCEKCGIEANQTWVQSRTLENFGSAVLCGHCVVAWGLYAASLQKPSFLKRWLSEQIPPWDPFTVIIENKHHD